MGRLSLVIADNDADYVRNLENYLMVHYSQRFDIYSVTTSGYAAVFLLDGSKRMNILLLGSGFDDNPFPLQRFDAVIRLADTNASGHGGMGRGGAIYNCAEHDGMGSGDAGYDSAGHDGNMYNGAGFASAVKYQHVERLIAGIFRVYSRSGTGNMLPELHKKTMVISVFSPAGGSGKTGISAGCSMLCAQRGKKVFYLNLESLSSAPLYFKGESSRNFSNIIYYLKEKDCNIALKLEAATCSDAGSGVCFFLPPDSSTEMGELTPEELDRLINGFRQLSCYDIVFIDMPAGLDRNVISLLKASDVVVQVYGPDAASSYKRRILQREQDILCKKYSLDLSGKSVFVLNKHRGDETGETGDIVGTSGICGKSDTGDIGGTSGICSTSGICGKSDTGDIGGIGKIGKIGEIGGVRNYIRISGIKGARGARGARGAKGTDGNGGSFGTGSSGSDGIGGSDGSGGTGNTAGIRDIEDGGCFQAVIRECGRPDCILNVGAPDCFKQGSDGSIPVSGFASDLAHLLKKIIPAFENEKATFPGGAAFE